MKLSELLNERKGDRSYEALERDCGGVPKAARLQQIATKPPKTFPDPDSIRGLARGLRVPERVVLAAAAESLGLRDVLDAAFPEAYGAELAAHVYLAKWVGPYLWALADRRPEALEYREVRAHPLPSAAREGVRSGAMRGWGRCVSTTCGTRRCPSRSQPEHRSSSCSAWSGMRPRRSPWTCTRVSSSRSSRPSASASASTRSVNASPHRAPNARR